MAASIRNGNLSSARRISARRSKHSTSRRRGRTAQQHDGIYSRRFCSAGRSTTTIPAPTLSRTSGPPSLQSETVGQNRTLTNAGLRSDVSYVKGIHNVKVGVTYEQTFLTKTIRWASLIRL